MGQPELDAATMGDLLTQVKRIADVLDASMSPRCGEKEGEWTCFLMPRHVGHHVTSDGRKRWLEDE